MSWISSALEKVGISKDTQRAVTAPALTALAPVTGGLSLAAIPFFNKGATTPGAQAPQGLQDVIGTVQSAYPGTYSPQGQVKAFLTSPVGLAAVGLVIYLMVRKK